MRRVLTTAVVLALASASMAISLTSADGSGRRDRARPAAGATAPAAVLLRTFRYDTVPPVFRPAHSFAVKATPARTVAPRRATPPATAVRAVSHPSPAPSAAKPAPQPAARPAPTPAPTSGCTAALAYLATHAAPGFRFECPGYALGHQAMTCVNVAGVCPGQRLIAIAVACPASWMNEASNSWVLIGESSRPIDPYGYC
jgi:hypothetical protein